MSAFPLRSLPDLLPRKLGRPGGVQPGEQDAEGVAEVVGHGGAARVPFPQPRAIGVVAWMPGDRESRDTALDTWFGAGPAATTAPDR